MIKKKGIPKFQRQNGLSDQKPLSYARVYDFMTLGQRLLESVETDGSERVIQPLPSQNMVPDQLH